MSYRCTQIPVLEIDCIIDVSTARSVSISEVLSLELLGSLEK